MSRLTGGTIYQEEVTKNDLVYASGVATDSLRAHVTDAVASWREGSDTKRLDSNGCTDSAPCRPNSTTSKV